MRAHADAETSAAIFVDFEKFVETIEHVPDTLVLTDGEKILSSENLFDVLLWWVPFNL